MIKSNFKSNQSGFTLVEATIALAILVVGILASLTVFPFGLRIAKDAELQTVATTLAQGEMESLLAQPYDNLSTGNTRVQFSADPQSPFYLFEKETDIRYVDQNLQVLNPNDPGFVDPNLKRVSISIYWISSFNPSKKSVNLISLHTSSR